MLQIKRVGDWENEWKIGYEFTGKGSLLEAVVLSSCSPPLLMWDALTYIKDQAPLVQSNRTNCLVLQVGTNAREMAIAAFPVTTECVLATGWL